VVLGMGFEVKIGLGAGIWAKFGLGNGIWIPPFRTLFGSNPRIKV